MTVGRGCRYLQARGLPRKRIGIKTMPGNFHRRFDQVHITRNRRAVTVSLRWFPIFDNDGVARHLRLCIPAKLVLPQPRGKVLSR